MNQKAEQAYNALVEAIKNQNKVRANWYKLLGENADGATIYQSRLANIDSEKQVRDLQDKMEMAMRDSAWEEARSMPGVV